MPGLKQVRKADLGFRRPEGESATVPNEFIVTPCRIVILLVIADEIKPYAYLSHEAPSLRKHSAISITAPRTN